LLISQNTALFSLVGTQYGGDGRSTFGLPNLQGRVPMHTDEFSGQDQYPIGASGGVESVTLTLQELPAHSHAFIGTTSAANVKRPVSARPTPKALWPAPRRPLITMVRTPL